MHSLINIENVVPRLQKYRFREPINWHIKNDEQWAIVGPNGSGKTILAGMLQQKYALAEGHVIYAFDGRPSEQIKSIAFKDIYSLADCRGSYYQQRWNSTETDEFPTVENILGDRANEMETTELLQTFGIKNLLSERIIFLSSGELRKFLIIRTLLNHPRLLIIDNPFIGLDAKSIGILREMLLKLTELKGIQTVLLLSDPDDIPEIITNVKLVNRRSLTELSRLEFQRNVSLQRTLFFGDHFDEETILPTMTPIATTAHRVTIRMEHVNIRYGNRTILNDINWEVLNGEKWALTGPNGSGKSTLLSLVCADNPQAYANTIWLFDRRRGTGESIWDIKKRIGYISPEMHLFYSENVSVFDIVCSGFFETVGLWNKCSDEQRRLASAWMDVFRIGYLRDCLFSEISSGEQRLALLTRAFVKNPDLIILDEPLHGLDICRKKLVTNIIEKFCAFPGKTLVYVTHNLKDLPNCIDKHFELTKQE